MAEAVCLLALAVGALGAGGLALLRKSAAQKAAEERYRQLLDCNPLGMVVVGQADGRIAYANQRAADLLGLPRERAVGAAAVDFYADPADRGRATALFARQGHLTDYEVRLKSAAGRTAWCLMTTSPTVYEGRPCNVSSIIDITGRKQAEESLRAKAQSEAVERRQRAILENLPVGVLVTTGPEHKIVYQNPRLEAMFGYTIGEIPDAAHWWPLAYPDPAYRQAMMAQWELWMARFARGEKELEPLEVTVTTRQGAAKQVAVHVGAMDEFYCITFIDLAERRQAEEARLARDAALAASQAKSRFLANVSHEIRTPLNAILGFAQVLEHDPRLDGDQREMLSAIRGGGGHLLELINDILDTAKAEAGRMELRRQAFDPGLLAGNAAALLRRRALERGLALEVEAEGLPGRVEGDPARLRQVLTNLLSNAVKFTPAGRVALRAEALEGGRVRFSVEDTGMGIAPEELPLLFEPFSQTASGRRVREGTGLGLALSRQFVRMMGGELQVCSAPGQGSRFFFTLPLPLPGAAGPAGPEPWQPPGAALPPPAALPREEAAARLARCPAGWLGRLRAALDRGDSARIGELVAQAGELDPDLRAVLAKWAYDCDHEAFLEALGEAGARAPDG